MGALRLGAAIAVIATGLVAGSALADGPPPSYPPGYTPMYAPTLTYDWTGIYFGGQIGAANSRIEWTYDLRATRRSTATPASSAARTPACRSSGAGSWWAQR